MFSSSPFEYGSTTAFARLLRVASCVLSVVVISACAATPMAFNPDGLPDAQLSRVAQVCQNVMGLNPSEPLMGGNWLGGPSLPYWTNHYRACITSLSDTLQRRSDLEATREADRECRAKGYADGTPDLALCVLQSKRRTSASNGPQLVTALDGPGAQELPTAGGSFFYASGRETRRREENACAVLGLESADGAFGACVNDLQGIFHSIDTPID
jgi:hypothetical protein